jgi:hypothetical protein
VGWFLATKGVMGWNLKTKVTHGVILQFFNKEIYKVTQQQIQNLSSI